MLAYVILVEMLVRCNYFGNQETGFLLSLFLFYYVGESGGILKSFHCWLEVTFFSLMF